MQLEGWGGAAAKPSLGKDPELELKGKGMSKPEGAVRKAAALFPSRIAAPEWCRDTPPAPVNSSYLDTACAYQ